MPGTTPRWGFSGGLRGGAALLPSAGRRGRADPASRFQYHLVLTRPRLRPRNREIPSLLDLPGGRIMEQPARACSAIAGCSGFRRRVDGRAAGQRRPLEGRVRWFRLDPIAERDSVKRWRTFAAIWRSVILSTVSTPAMRRPRVFLFSRFFSSPFASPGPNIRMDSASPMHAITAS